MLVIKDFATTTLASALPVSATTMTVSDVSRLPVLASGDYFYLVLQKFADRNYVEIVKVVEINGAVLTINRAQDGTTIKSFAAGDYAELRLTSKGFSEYISQNYNQTLHDHNHDFTAHPELAAALDVRVSKAESSATAAMMSAKVYSTVALGLAETPVDQYFSVLSGNVNQYVNLYLNNAGAAKLEKTYPTDKALDDWQRAYSGLFLHAPYYEDSGAGLYFKPSNYGGNYIYIRGGYLADAAFTYDKLKDDLSTSIPVGCEIGVTSPFGATDCIKLAPFTTLWYDPATQTFSWGARAKKNYFIKFLEYNSSSVARCEEYPVIVDAKHGQNAVKANSKIPCQIIPSLNTAPYIPNIDTAAKTLTFYADTILEAGWGRYVVAATTAVDLSVGTSAVVVYYDRINSVFVPKAWNYNLTDVEKYNFVLVAALRLGTVEVSTHMSISCPYTVDGREVSPVAPDSQPTARVYPPLVGATAANPKVPDYNTVTRTFTLYADTILQSQDTSFVLPADMSIVVSGTSSANRVWWNTATDTLETAHWSSIQTKEQLRNRVLVATIRYISGSATVSMDCPCTLNGVLGSAVDWQRAYSGLFLHAPYYEDSGTGLYFKPTSYGGNYIYIRGGYLADASFTYDKFKSDLSTSIPVGCAIGVTSPFGVTDCIKLAGFSTLWYDPATQTFSWGARAKKNYFIKLLEYNSSSAARCEEYPVIVDAKHGQNAVKANSKIPCQVIPSGATPPYIPNVDTVAKTLTFYADTILEFGWTRYVVAATTAVDLSVGTSAVVVYFDRTTSTFVAKAWNYTLTEVEKYNFVLVAALRLGASIASTSVSISCPYLVDGKRGAAEPPSTQPVAQIYTPLYGATSVDPKLPNFDTSTSVFTLYRDTMLQSRDMEWVLPADVNFTVNTSSTAVRVWWNTVTNTLESNSWSANQSAQQLQERVLVTTIRNTAGRATLSINCPYTVNGRLFDALDASDTVLPNPLDANVRCIMHRGFSGAAPENTLPAFKKAAEFFNYYIESDIQWTSDNVPVMLHDSTIDRTSDGSGAIGAMTLAQVKTYDFGSWYGPAYAGTKIPTFEETMRCMKNLGLHGYMEIKSSGITTEQIHILQNILHKTGMMGRIIYISFSYTALQNMVALYPNQDVAYLGTMSSALIASAVALKTGSNKVAVDASWGSITAAFVEEAHVNGLDVVAWTVNSSATAVNLGNMGVDGITTDSLNIAQVLRTSELG